MVQVKENQQQHDGGWFFLFRNYVIIYIFFSPYLNSVSDIFITVNVENGNINKRMHGVCVCFEKQKNK